MVDLVAGAASAGRQLIPAGAVPRHTTLRMERNGGRSDGSPSQGTAVVPTRGGRTGFTRPEAEQELIYGETVEPDVTRSPLATPRRRSRSNTPIDFEPSPKGGPAPRHIASVLLFGILLLLGLPHWNHAPDLRADQLGQFLSESRAFAEQRPLSDIGLVATGFQPTISVGSQPPGFALMGVLAVLPGGDAISILRVPTALALVALCLFAFWYVRRSDGFASALAVTAWCATALLAQHALDTPLPELFWAGFAWAAFVVADNSRAFTPGRMARLSLLVSIALLFQRSALALIPTLAVAALIRPERERRAFALAAGIAAVTGLLLILFPRQTWLTLSLERTPSQLAADIALNIRNMADGVRAVYLSPFPWRWSNLAWHAIAISLTTWGALELVKRDLFRLAMIFAVAYSLTRLPAASRALSDAWVLWPLQLLALVHGARLLAQRGAALEGSRRRLSLMAMGTALLLAAGSWRSLSARRPPRLISISAVHDVTEHLRARGGTRVAFFAPRMLTWETRLDAMPLFVASPDETVAELRGRQVTHVILGDLNTETPGAVSMARAVAARPDAFRRLHENGAFTLFDVVYP